LLTLVNARKLHEQTMNNCVFIKQHEYIAHRKFMFN